MRTRCRNKPASSWEAHAFFFFSSRRRHTRLQGDWSSDVCSSDLRNLALTKARLAWVRLERGEPDAAVRAFEEANRLRPDEGAVLLGLGAAHLYRGEIGRASCRERV